MNVDHGAFLFDHIVGYLERRYAGVGAREFAGIVGECFGAYLTGAGVRGDGVGGGAAGGDSFRRFRLVEVGDGGPFVECADGTGDGLAGAGSGSPWGPGPGFVGDTRVVSGFAPRGPNYERNRRNRERRKQAKRERLAGEAEVAELQLKVKAEELRRRMYQLEASAGTEEKKAELSAKRLESSYREAVGKENRHKAGLDHVAEAMRLVKDAVAAAECAKYQPVAGVAGWAATVASSSAESVARSSTSAISLKSVSSATSAAAMSVAKGPLNVVEELLVENGVTTEKVIRSARAKVGRKLGLDDIFRADAPFKMSSAVKREIALAGAGLPKEDYHEYY